MIAVAADLRTSLDMIRQRTLAPVKIRFKCDDAGSFIVLQIVHGNTLFEIFPSEDEGGVVFINVKEVELIARLIGVDASGISDDLTQAKAWLVGREEYEVFETLVQSVCQAEGGEFDESELYFAPQADVTDWRKSLIVGSAVHWIDPDDGIASGSGYVSSVAELGDDGEYPSDGYFEIHLNSGSFAGAKLHELYPLS